MDLIEQLTNLFFELNLYSEQVRNRVLPQYLDDPDSPIERHPGIHIVNPASMIANRHAAFQCSDYFSACSHENIFHKFSEDRLLIGRNIEKYFFECISNRSMVIEPDEEKRIREYSTTFPVKEEDMDSSWDLDIERAATLYADFYHMRREFILEYNGPEKLENTQYRNPEIRGLLYCGVPKVEYLEYRPYFYTPEMVARTIEILKEKYGYKFTYNSVESGNYEKYFFSGIRRDDPNRTLFTNQDDIRQIVWIIE